MTRTIRRTIRVDLELDKLVLDYAIKTDIGADNLSDAYRKIINIGLKATSRNIEKNILIEILMILRSTIKSDEQYEKILQTIDEFKTVQELGDE